MNIIEGIQSHRDKVDAFLKTERSEKLPEFLKEHGIDLVRQANNFAGLNVLKCISLYHALDIYIAEYIDANLEENDDEFY